MKQLDLFANQPITFTITTDDVKRHKERMAIQVKNKSGAINRLIRARYDDILAEKIAAENIQLKKEIEELKEMLKDKSA